jgi:ligand-binding sensor domain-containing protein/signal transduction histidine kinase
MRISPPKDLAMRNYQRTLAAAWLLLGGSLWESSGASNDFLKPRIPYTIDVWQTDDGLPGSSVISMAQTRDGYLWLGTLYGLVRFDGIRFTVFDENTIPELKSSPIVSLFEDSQGNLWIGTETAGVVLVKDGVVSTLDIGRGNREGRLASICEDTAGAVWFFTADGQLWRYREGATNVFTTGTDWASRYRGLVAEKAGLLWIGTDWRQFAVNPTAPLKPPELGPKQDVPVSRLDYLLASPRGGCWRLGDGLIQKWQTNYLERTLGSYPAEWNRALITAACEDREGNLIVGTLGAGVFWFDAGGNPTRLCETNGLSSDLILSLHADREGTLWVGTDGGGLNRVKRQVFEVLDASLGLTVQSVCEDGEGGLWIGCNGGEVIRSKGGSRKRFRTIPMLAVDPSVRAVFADSEQRVWVGTVNGGLFVLRNHQFQPVGGPEPVQRVVQAIHQDRGGRLWLGTRGGLARFHESGWRIYSTRDGLSAEEISAIADDREGNLWIGTRGGGLNRFRDDKFVAFRKRDGLPSEDISSLLADAEGVLWIGTSGSGLVRFHAGKWTRYTTREGLVSNSVGYLIEDLEGYLWIGSNAGLTRVKKQALNDFAEDKASFIPFRAYGKPDGLPTRECTLGSQPAAYRGSDGTLWFPTTKGLASVKPSQLHPNTNPPPVIIEAVFVEGQSQVTDTLRPKFRQAVTVPAGKEGVEIHYTSLSLTAPNTARFRYRLDGHETAWTEAGNIRVARYTKLPPGDYLFQVTACNEDGVWNESGSSLAFIVEPPFWQTWWFLTGAGLFLLGTIVGSVHYLSTQKLQRQLEGLRQHEALEKERGRIARDIHDQLGANLTQVALLGELVESDKDSPTDVEAHARMISQTARDTTRSLDEIVWTVNPSNDTLDGLITYLCKYAQEYLEVAGLRYRLDAPAQLPNTPIAPEVRHNVFLAAKEAITNVVRHAQASAVHLRLRIEGKAFVLEIEDDGRGVAGLDTRTSRHGLRNMRKRMEDVAGSFSISAAPGGGAVVRLTVPLANG